MCTRQPRLVLVSLVIGWKNGTRTLKQSLSEVMQNQNNLLITFDAIALIHDSRHVGFQIVMQISHVLCWGANNGIKANCVKSARRNIELTLLKVHFRI